MQILVLLGMYFDAVLVFVTSQTLLFRLALAILWIRPILEARAEIQKYFRWILVQMKSLEFTFEIK